MSGFGVAVRRVATGIATVVVIVAFACGCGASNASDETDGSRSGGERLASSLQAYAGQLLADGEGMSDEQKAILEKAERTGEVSVSDYKAAWDRYATCMQDKGYKRPAMQVYSNGLQHPREFTMTDEQASDPNYSQKFNENEIECQVAHVDAVNKLYTAQVGNPNLYASHEEGAVDCLKREGLVPKSYTVEQYQSDRNTEAHVSPGEKAKTTYDPNNPNVLACLAANGNIFLGDMP